MKLTIATFAALLLLGCKNEPTQKRREVNVPSNGESLILIKAEDTSDYTKSGYKKLYNEFDDLLADLSRAEYLGRIAYKQLPVTWWAGVTEFNLQHWKVTTNQKTLSVTVYERTSAPGRIINVCDRGEPSDYYAVSIIGKQ